jgi:type II secretory pathway component PulF
MLFCRQAAAYLSAGVDLLKALSSLETQFARTALGPVIGRIQLAGAPGDALAEAMAREPKAFDALFLSMIRVAEARGGVPGDPAPDVEALRGPPAAHPPGTLGMIYPIAVLLSRLRRRPALHLPAADVRRVVADIAGRAATSHSPAAS